MKRNQQSKLEVRVASILALVLLLALGYIFTFGERSNSGALELVRPTTPEALALVGEWESVSDVNFKREFLADGAIVDSYQGALGADIKGAWLQVLDPSKEALPAGVDLSSGMLVKLIFGQTTLYLVVNDVTDEALSLTYLGGQGEILAFKRLHSISQP